MEITPKELLELHGYAISNSGGGCMWATKTDPEDPECYLAVTCVDGLDIPESIHDPILYGKYYYESGDCVSCEEIISLRELFLGCRCGEEKCQLI